MYLPEIPHQSLVDFSLSGNCEYSTCHMQHFFSHLKMCNTSGATLPNYGDRENRIRRGYRVVSFFYFSVLNKNKEDPMIYGLIVVALLPCAAYGLY